MSKKVSLDEKGLLSMLAREFNFSLASKEEKRRLQTTMYVLNAAGIKTGYGFSEWSFQHIYSTDMIYDLHHIISNPKEYEETKEYSFDKKTKQILNEVKENFLNPIKTQKQLELLTSTHYIFNNHYRHESGLFHKFKKNFKKQNPKMQILGSKIKTDELKQAWVQAANLISYRNYYDSLNS
ncbi:MAG: hypothetical protein AABW67_02525 [Nanoarchaeota archaeon]